MRLAMNSVSSLQLNSCKHVQKWFLCGDFCSSIDKLGMICDFRESCLCSVGGVYESPKTKIQNRVLNPMQIQKPRKGTRSTDVRYFQIVKFHIGIGPLIVDDGPIYPLRVQGEKDPSNTELFVEVELD